MFVSCDCLTFLVGYKSIVGHQNLNTMSLKKNHNFCFTRRVQGWTKFCSLTSFFLFGVIRWPLFYIKHFAVLINNLCAVDIYGRLSRIIYWTPYNPLIRVILSSPSQPSRDSNSDRPVHRQFVTSDELDRSAMGPRSF